MGLFSSKKVITVGTAVSRVIDNASLPNAIKTGVVKAILNDGNIPDYALEELIGGIGARAERAYTYAKNTYTHGLPTGQFKRATGGQAEVIAVLSAIEGTAVVPTYTRFGPPNSLHIGWMKLISDHGYNPATNQLAALTTIKGKTVYLDDMTVVVPAGELATYNEGALAQWGTPATAGYTPERSSQFNAGGLAAATPVRTEVGTFAVYVRVAYIWVETPASIGVVEVLGRDSFTISLAGFDVEADYFHAKYTVAGVTKYWMYKDDTGTYPALDAVFFTEAQTNGTFFPFLYFRYGAVSEASNKTTPAYLTSRKLAKYYGMNYDEVADGIDSNPDIGQVQQAMMIMAVPANTTDPLERRYLFEFFDAMYYMDAVQFSSRIQAGITIAQGANGDISKNTLVIQDSRFKMAISNAGMYKRRVVGSIGVKGTYTSGTGSVSNDVAYTYTTSGIEGGGDIVSGISTVTTPYHFYRYQVSNHIYEEIQVSDLRTLYYIYEGRFETADGAEQILLIPLDRSITHQYSLQDRERIYSRAMHFVFNSVTITKVKWYQTGFFADLLKIVGLVLIVISLGSATGPLATLMSAIGTGVAANITAAVLVILEKILVGLVIGAALKIFVKAVGADVAFLLAIVAAATGVYLAFDAGSIAGAPWAETLLQLSSGLTDGIKAELKDLFGDLIEEYQTFNLFKEESTKQLEAANKLLEHNNWLSPFVVFGEKPDDYYNRTVHAGNTGVLSLGAISYYVDNALKLPKLDETLEG